MRMRWNEKIVLITGGASGIGRELGFQLAKKQAFVFLLDINAEAVEKAASEIGMNVRGCPLDVSDRGAFAALAQKIHSEYGRIDCLFNNAGVSLSGEVRDMLPADWDRLLNVNLRGVVHGVEAVYPLMIRQGFGFIANMSSISGITPLPLSAGYNTTKFAVFGLSMSLRSEASLLGVNVSAVCPGFIDTPMKDNMKYASFEKELAQEKLPFRLQPVEYCARKIIRGLEKNKAIIVITPPAVMLWFLYRISPGLFGWISRLAVKKSHAIRKH